MWTYLFWGFITYIIIYVAWFIYEIHTAPEMPDEYDRPILKDESIKENEKTE